MMDFLSDSSLQTSLQDLLSPFTHYAYSVSAFLILIFSAILTTFWIWSRQRVMLADIHAASQAVLPRGNAEAFTADYSDISEAFKANVTLRRSWEEFEETLIPPMEDVDDPSYKVFRNTKRPAEFFQSSSLLNRLTPFFKPEDFIGIGLLLTFVGLVAALVEAGSGLGQGDTQGMRETILTLLETAGAKFIASIGGVTGSLIVSISQHRLLGTVRRRLDRLSDALEERLVYASAEKIAADQYGHMKRQTANLERLSNEIAVAIGDKIESAMSRMPTMMGEAMQPVTDKLDDVAGQIGQTSTEGMADMVNQLSSELKGAGQESMQQVVSQLDTLGSTMSGTVSSLRETTELLRESLTNSAKQAASDLSGSSDLFSQKIAQAVELMERSQTDLRSTLEGLVQQLHSGSQEFDEKLSETRDRMQRDLVASLGAMNEHIAKQARQASNEWQGQINDAISKGAQQTAAQLQTAAKDMGDQLREPMSEVQMGLRDWVEKTQAVTGALEAINSQLGAHRDGIAISTRNLVDASTAMESASSAVRETTVPMRDAAAAAKETTQRLLEITQSTSSSVAEFSSQVGSSVAQTQKIVEALEAAWREQTEQLRGADAELERAFGAISSNLAASLARLSEFHQGMDKNLGRAVEGLGSIVEELSDSVEALQQ